MGLFKSVFGTGSWDTLPSVFVQSLKEELGKDDFFLLDHFSKKYKIFDQKFFQNNESFESDPDFRIDMFSNFLGSMGNQIAQNGEFQDAEKIYLLSLKIKEKNNPSHGGLAILYAQAGRIKEAKSEAAKALKILKELEESSVPIPEKVAPPGSLDDMHEILSSIINLNNRDYTNDKKKFMSVVTAFKDTTQKDKIPTCWSGIRFTDGSQCQISVAHKVMIYKGKSMFGGKFYDADARDIRVLLSGLFSMNEVFTLMRGLPVEHELLHTPVDGMNHPLLIIYTNLALKCNTVEEFKDLLNNAK